MTSRRSSSSSSSYEHYKRKSVVRKVEDKPKNYSGSESKRESVDHERQHGGHKSNLESPRHKYPKFSPNAEKQTSEERKQDKRRIGHGDIVSTRPSTSRQSALSFPDNRKSSEDHANSSRVRGSKYNEHHDRSRPGYSRSPAHEERDQREELRSSKRPMSRERLDLLEPPPRLRERPRSMEERRSPPAGPPRSREYLRSREAFRPRERPNLLGTPPPGRDVNPNIIYVDHGSRYECKSIQISRNYDGPKKLTMSFFV